MIFRRVALLCASLVPFAASLEAGDVVENPSGCLTEVVEGVDYFQHKVQPIESQFWSIEYANTYKVIANKAANETYLLYQCGTELPEEELAKDHDVVVSVPFNETALSSSTMVPFLELLGLRTRITTYLGTTQFITSPCLQELARDDAIEEILDPTDPAAYANVSVDLPVFIGNSGDVPLENRIRISSTEEETNLAYYEWLKVYAACFNREEMANSLFDEAEEEYSCAEDNAGIIESDMGSEPVVLWAEFSDYCNQTWSVAKCPEYYCEFASACSSNILSSDTQGSVFVERCGRNYMSTEEFVEFGKDADVWIYTGFDSLTALSLFKDELQDFKSVQNQEVYDVLGQGFSAWFGYRVAEPSVVLQDFCAVVGTENEFSKHQRTWFRHIYTEAAGSLGQCEDVDAPLNTTAACVRLPAVQDGNGEGDSGEPGDDERDNDSDGANDSKGTSAARARSALVGRIVAVILSAASARM